MLAHPHNLVLPNRPESGSKLFHKNTANSPKNQENFEEFQDYRPKIKENIRNTPPSLCILARIIFTADLSITCLPFSRSNTLLPTSRSVGAYIYAEHRNDCPNALSSCLNSDHSRPQDE